MSIKKILKTKKCKRFISYLKEITDDRQQWKVKHKQYSILFIIILAMYSGCNKFKEFYYFGIKHSKRLSKMINLENGIPSHDTMERAMHRIKSEEFNNLVFKYVYDFLPDVIHVCIDGKFVKATKDVCNNNQAIDIISAHVAGIKVNIYSEQALTKESNKTETSIMKVVLEKLYDKLKGKKVIITIDAIAAVNPILSKIVSYGWEYIICIKKRNKGNKNWGMYEQVKDEFETLDKKDYYIVSENKNGRTETRKYLVKHDLQYIEILDKWPTVKGIGKLESISVNNKTGDVSKDVRYFLFSNPFTKEKFAKVQREHWQIESFHYILDNSFREDRMRMKKGSSTLNTNLLRKFVTNILSINLANSTYGYVTSHRDRCKILSSPQEILYSIINPSKSPKIKDF